MSVAPNRRRTPAQIAPAPAPPLFSDKERAAIVAYWNVPGRYTLAAPPDTTTEGPYRVRLTPDGSQWFLNYQHVVNGKSKLPPTADARGGSKYADWETWIVARLAYDKAMAQQSADLMNRPFIAARSTTEPRTTLASRGTKRGAERGQDTTITVLAACTRPDSARPAPCLREPAPICVRRHALAVYGAFR